MAKGVSVIGIQELEKVFVNVPAELQKKAVKVLVEYGFNVSRTLATGSSQSSGAMKAGITRVSGFKQGNITLHTPKNPNGKGRSYHMIQHYSKHQSVLNANWHGQDHQFMFTTRRLVNEKAKTLNSTKLI